MFRGHLPFSRLQLLPIVVCYVCIAFISTISDAVTHERNLIWAQKEERTGAARLVGVRGDPSSWVVSRSAATRYITAPNTRWRFTALGYDYRRGTVYWSDTGNKKIQGLQLNGSQAAFSVFEGSSSQVNGITVDWVTGNVYWTDSLYNWIVLSPGRRGTSLHAVIVSTGLDRPAGIAVSPQNGLLFWADWGHTPKIERSTCAGHDRRRLVTDDVMKPLGMTLDHSRNVLYWADGAKGAIETCDIYGQNRKTFFKVKHASFFGIALYKDYIFATEQREKQLHIFDVGKARHEVKFSTSARPYDVIMYDENTQEEMNDPCVGAGCAHLCVPAGRGVHQCLCARGYRLRDDRKSCTEDGHFGSPQYIYSIGSALCRFPGNMADMSLANVSLDTQCFLTHRKGALALTAHVLQDRLYFSENKTRTISMLRLSEGSASEVIVGGTGSVEGLALDWIASNLYWTDAIFKQVMVARSDGRFQKQLVSSDLEKPRGIAVDAVNRYLFWSDVGQPPKIERSKLDGRSRATFVSSGLASPNHIVIDYRTASLYWSDSVRGRLECIGLDGNKRRVVISQPGTSMFGVTVFQDFIAWTDRRTRNGLHTAVRDTGHKVRGIIHPGIGTAYDVITYDSSLQPLVKGPCGNQNGGCEHLCLAAPGGGRRKYVCHCAMGFVKSGDGRSCIADAYYDNFVLFTDTYHKQIYQMALASGAFHAVPLASHANPIAVDYDPLRRKVYWTDVAEKVIKCAFLNGTGEKVVRQLGQNSVPDGLAVEPRSRLAYYTDAGVKAIGAVTMDTGHHHVIIDENLDQPRAIVLDPGRGHMYWTDWGLHSRIEKAAMDGSSRRRLVSTGLGAWPNGLAIDPKSERLYWCDARADRIEMTDLEGNARRVLYRDAESHFFGIATLAGTVFYTDWTKKSIMQIDTLADRVHPKPLGPTLFARLNDIHVYKSNYLEKSYSDNACGYRNGGCSHLCLPVPSGRSCACPVGLMLVSGYRCVTKEKQKGDTSSPANTRRPMYDVLSSFSPITSTSSQPIEPYTSVSTLKATTTTTMTSTASTTSLPTTSSTTTATTTTSTEKTTSTSPQTTSTETTSISTSTTTQTTTSTTTKPTSTLPPPTQATTVTKRTRFPSRGNPIDNTGSTSYDVDRNLFELVIDKFTLATTMTTYRKTPPPGEDQTLTDSGQESPGGGTTIDSGGGRFTTPGHVDTHRTTEVSTHSTAKGTGDVTSHLEPSDKLEDFEFSMFALLAIIIGGIVMMCLIVVSGIILYKKMDPGRPAARRRARVDPPPLSTLSDIYEMPDKELESPGGERSASRYGYLHEGYYNGDLDSSMEGDFSRAETLNTYEEIVEDSGGQERGHISFSTFR